MYLQCVKRSLMQRHNMFSVNITENCPGHRSENCVCTVCVKEREGGGGKSYAPKSYFRKQSQPRPDLCPFNPILNLKAHTQYLQTANQ